MEIGFSEGLRKEVASAVYGACLHEVFKLLDSSLALLAQNDEALFRRHSEAKPKNPVLKSCA